MPLRLFVYGTLKRGYHNFERYCSGVAMVEAASTIGRLYLLPEQYPMLVVPAAHAIALGTQQPLVDMATQERMAEQWRVDRPAWPPFPEGDWEQISGEVLTFTDAAVRLPPLDNLEDFRPGETSIYHRALVPVDCRGIEPIWTYIAPRRIPPSGARRIGASWPENRQS